MAVTPADPGQTLSLKAEISELRSALKGDTLRLENRFEQRFTELQVTTQRYVTAGIATNAIAVSTALVI